ncbi:hypothetical protein [Fusibacter bizertensis]
MNFLRFQTRINTDIYGAFRMLTKVEKISKWTQVSAEYMESTPYTQVVWQFKDAPSYEFNLMKCAAKTEYCTEIHLIIKLNSEFISNENETKDDFIALESAKAIALLESLRKHFNKDWIIQDRDLTAGILRGSF